MDLKKILPENGPPMNEVNKYIEKYKNDLIVIKYGGNVLIDRNIFENFITDLSILNKLGLSVIVVHGGGPRIKRELDKSNIQSKFIRGLRVTDEKIINIVESVLIDFNNDIVSSLNKKNTKAVSIHTKKDNIIVDKNNQTHNINGDTAAMAVAKSVKSRRLLLMTNVDGVLNKEKKLIDEISSSEILEMVKDETITEGMIPKINACLDAVNNGVTAAGIINGTKQHSCLWEIFSDKGSGTLIRK